MGNLGQKLLLAFEGTHALPEHLRSAMREYRPSGFTLFRAFNVEKPAQVRELTERLQAEAGHLGLPPLLIACDQEGGQLLAINEGVAQLPGNLALGATGSTGLAFQAGQVLGSELAAMGVNVNYGPVCDVNINPLNPVIGTRSFGEDPVQVAALAAAMTQGIQSRGVAAGAKHFPGHGDTAGDSHYGIPQSPHGLERLRAVEFPPFAAAIQAGARLVMTAHLALPAVEGRDDLPATLSPRILQKLLRQELGFDGVIVTDAMDMHAIQQGEALIGQAAQAALAGADLLLVTRDPEDWRRAFAGLHTAFAGGDAPALRTSLGRIAALKGWLASATPAPDLSVVGCAAHRAVADEIAARSMTLVRDQAPLLPLRPSETPRLAVILFQPQDLTPADTSSYVQISLAAALRQYLPAVDEYLLPHAPGDGEIASVLAQIPEQTPLLIGTINAFAQPGQAALVHAALAAHRPVIVAALRMPYDLAAFPSAPTFLCTYGILEPSMQALARVLVGQAEAKGRLPVSIPTH
jgi:beta-N-acetylhexosaminidase